MLSVSPSSKVIYENVPRHCTKRAARECTTWPLDQPLLRSLLFECAWWGKTTVRVSVIKVYPASVVLLGRQHTLGCLRCSQEYFDYAESVQARKYAFKCHRKVESGRDIVYPVNTIAFHPILGTFATGGAFSAFQTSVMRGHTLRGPPFTCVISDKAFCIFHRAGNGGVV
jgi:hypothetical protein